MQEIWKPISGYGNNYLVSNLGQVKSLHNATSKILKPRFAGKYLRVALQYKGVRKQLSVSRLVAQAFIPNPNDLPCVNHKDENKLNNRADNLEWCTRKYNMNYGTCIERKSKALKGKPLSAIRKARMRHPKGMTWKEFEAKGGKIIYVD